MIETAHHIYIDKCYKELYTFFKNLGMEEMFSMDFDRDDVLKRAIKIEANVTNKDKQKVSDYLDGKLVLLSVLISMAVIIHLNSFLLQ